MPIISSDVDGAIQYSFAAHGSNVVLKEGVVYNYTGSGAAILMDSSYDHFLAAGIVYSQGDGVNFNSYGAYIDIAKTGMIVGTGGAGINFTQNSGSVTINNFGVVEGQNGINAGGATGYVFIYNSGIIQADRSYTDAIDTGSAGDIVNNTGTILGSISTAAGNDTIDTHLGVVNGTIFGGAGADTYIIAANQKISEYQYPQDDGANDVVQSYGDFTLPQFVEELDLLGPARIGRGNSLDNTINGNDNGNMLYGGGGNDFVVAGGGDDILRGNDGNDQLESFEGSDIFYGGAGDDVVFVGLDQVQINGGTGIDVAAFLYNDTAIVADLNLSTGKVAGGAAATDTLTSIEGIYGSSFDDTLTGDGGANNFLGYDGNDTINGGAGNDVIEGYTGADKLDGGADVDTVSFFYDNSGVTMSLASGKGTAGAAAGDTYVNFENIRGGQGADVLTGSTTNNVIEGGAGNDIISGGGGDDTIYGDAGMDQLTGSSGKDVFSFRDIAPTANKPILGGFGQDTIVDFTDKSDHISFVGDSQVHSLADLTITQSGSSVIVMVNGTTDQITLLNFSTANISSADFLFG